ncbi:MAG: rRNA maturation RNase YbeY [Pseudomonas fluorescens]|nr:MAG: rRNA maturation RNase YbeY [Pseudomonas fluorescens]
MDVYHQAALHDEDDIMDDDMRPWALTIRFGGTEEGLALNSEFRHKDYATNVLSFPADEEDELDADVWYVGDIFICSPVLAREATELEKPVDDHLKHLVVHGMLHLIGYDHDLGEDEAEEMENLERAILADMGLPDPYLDHDKLEAKKGQ